MNKRSDDRTDIKIGIIGKGFVGTAVAHGFSHQTSYGADIKIYDIDPVKSQNTLEDTVNNSEFLFLSVPTPSSKDGTMDLSIVENALESMNDINQN
jgi:UDP-glucose 6-dehydrogenase